MIQLRWPRFLAEYFARQINRAPSPLVAVSVPWITIILASMAPAWPIIASAPLLPPLGFMMLLGWRQVRPGLLPVWAGLPLGLIDDIYSGQPFGNAILLWSLALIGFEIVEARFPWRNFAHDWLGAALVLLAYLVSGLVFANASGASGHIALILPQFILAVLLYPLAGRIVAACDRFRLLPFTALR